METSSSPEEQVLSTDLKSAHLPEENADVRRKRRFSTSFRASRNPEPSRGGLCKYTLDPCFRRGDGMGTGHGRGRLDFPVIPRKQESSRPAGACRVRCGAAARPLDPCFRGRRGQGSHRNPAGLWTPAFAGDGGRGHKRPVSRRPFARSALRATALGSSPVRWTERREYATIRPGNPGD